MPGKHTFHDGKSGAAIAIKVTPRSSRNEVIEILKDGTVKIHITAPPVDGKANQALIKFLSKILGVSGKQIDIVAGLSGRDKIVAVENMDAVTLHKKLLDSIEKEKLTP